ncbi:hypothetical protein [Nonomuraea aurantiaca]|uniref:hypothetical protein n=1 Tax=Nonomuraea aurantiaca TaxID=2878562 RepID=UPI001CDA0BAD|nr:hypothetical protein [Nonomuraea aurantiaca]MCA2229306.1 hypothetical protein [Nonomuraea aurantiaca]
MSKSPGGSGSAPRSRAWRWVAIATIVAMVALLALGLVGFFADPLHLPADVLGVLDQRASVVSMFIGAAGLVVAVAALLLQLRADRTQPTAAAVVPDRSDAGPETPPQVAASGERSIAAGGDNTGIASTGDGTRNVQMRAQASGQGRVYQADGDQIINEP